MQSLHGRFEVHCNAARLLLDEEPRVRRQHSLHLRLGLDHTPLVSTEPQTSERTVLGAMTRVPGMHHLNAARQLPPQIMPAVPTQPYTRHPVAAVVDDAREFRVRRRIIVAVFRVDRGSVAAVKVGKSGRAGGLFFVGGGLGAVCRYCKVVHWRWWSSGDKMLGNGGCFIIRSIVCWDGSRKDAGAAVEICWRYQIVSWPSYAGS